MVFQSGELANLDSGFPFSYSMEQDLSHGGQQEQYQFGQFAPQQTVDVSRQPVYTPQQSVIPPQPFLPQQPVHIPLQPVNIPHQQKVPLYNHHRPPQVQNLAPQVQLGNLLPQYTPESLASVPRLSLQKLGQYDTKQLQPQPSTTNGFQQFGFNNAMSSRQLARPLPLCTGAFPVHTNLNTGSNQYFGQPYYNDANEIYISPHSAASSVAPWDVRFLDPTFGSQALATRSGSLASLVSDPGYWSGSGQTSPSLLGRSNDGFYFSADPNMQAPIFQHQQAPAYSPQIPPMSISSPPRSDREMSPQTVLTAALSIAAIAVIFKVVTKLVGLYKKSKAAKPVVTPVKSRTLDTGEGLDDEFWKSVFRYKFPEGLFEDTEEAPKVEEVTENELDRAMEEFVKEPSPDLWGGDLDMHVRMQAHIEAVLSPPESGTVSECTSPVQQRTLKRSFSELENDEWNANESVQVFDYPVNTGTTTLPRFANGDFSQHGVYNTIFEPEISHPSWHQLHSATTPSDDKPKLKKLKPSSEPCTDIHWTPLRCLLHPFGCQSTSKEKFNPNAKFKCPKEMVKHHKHHGIGTTLKTSDNPHESIQPVFPRTIICVCSANFSTPSSIDPGGGTSHLLSTSPLARKNFGEAVKHLFTCEMARGRIERGEKPWTEEFYVCLRECGFLYESREEGGRRWLLALDAKPGRTPAVKGGLKRGLIKMLRGVMRV